MYEDTGINCSPGTELLKGLLGVVASSGHRSAEGSADHQGLGGRTGGGAEESGRATSGNAEQRGGRHRGSVVAEDWVEKEVVVEAGDVELKGRLCVFRRWLWLQRCREQMG